MFTPNEEYRYLAPPTLEQFGKIRTAEDLQAIVRENSVSLRVSELKPSGWAFKASPQNDLLEKLQHKSFPITKHIEGKPYFGIKTGFNETFVIDKETRDKLISQDPKSVEIIKPLLAGRDVRRYSAK